LNQATERGEGEKKMVTGQHPNADRLPAISDVEQGAAQREALITEATRRYPDDEPPSSDPFSETRYSATAMRHAFVQGFIFAHRQDRLIAAAPELLDLAKLLERSLVYEIRKSEKEGDDEGARMKMLTLAEVRRVISKGR
jgi:hypothetical protein